MLVMGEKKFYRLLRGAKWHICQNRPEMKSILVILEWKIGEKTWKGVVSHLDGRHTLTSLLVILVLSKEEEDFRGIHS